MIKNSEPKEELLKELEELKLENASLKVLYERDTKERKQAEEEKETLMLNLNERVKELNCLYSISSIVEIPNISLDGMLKQIVKAIPTGWQYSNITCARIAINKDDYKTTNYKETKWKQSSDIIINGKKAGFVEVFYLEEKTENDEGPFLKQERSLINAITQRLGNVTEQKRVELERQILFEITNGITTTGNLNELLKLIHHSLGKILYVDNFFVALYDQITGLFSFPYFVDKFDSTPEPIAIPKSCSAYVYRTGKPLLLTPELSQKLEEQNEIELIGSPSPSLVGVPLKIPDRTIGVLVLQHYEEENIYSESDVIFLNSVASQIAMVIERKKAEEEINKRNEKLSMINAEKDKFFSIIAHDLKSPFQGFLSLTKSFAEEAGSYSAEELAQLSNAMHQAADNLFNLLNNLLEWSQMQKGSVSFQPKELSLSDLILGNIELIKGRSVQKGIA